MDRPSCPFVLQHQYPVRIYGLPLAESSVVDMRAAIHRTYLFRLAITAVIAATLGVLAACRQGRPVIDTGPRPLQADGTISGTVRGPAGTSAIEGRAVEVENISTGARQRTTTNNAGGFTFKVPPGKYRVTLTLLDGEVIVKQPGVMDVNRSDVDAHADFVVGSSKVIRPRWPRLRGEDGLGPPIA